MALPNLCLKSLCCAPVDLRGSPQRPTRSSKRDYTSECYYIEKHQKTLYHSQNCPLRTPLSNFNKMQQEQCKWTELQTYRQTDNYCFLFPLQLLTMHFQHVQLVKKKAAWSVALCFKIWCSRYPSTITFGHSGTGCQCLPASFQNKRTCLQDLSPKLLLGLGDKTILQGLEKRSRFHLVTYVMWC